MDDASNDWSTTKASQVKGISPVQFGVEGMLFGDRRISFQMAFDPLLLDNPALADQAVDAVMRQCDRLKLRYQIHEIENELRIQEAEYEKQLEVRAENDASLMREIDAIHEKARTQDQRADDAFSRGQAEFEKSGRPGQYVPNGAVKSTIETAKREVAAARTNAANKLVEKKNAWDNATKTLDMMQTVMAKKRAEVERLKAETI